MGACAVGCFGGSTQCGNLCVDVQNDPAHCGACATVCKNGEVCTAGACSSLCGANKVKCGNLCTDTSSDVNNCGGCGVACKGFGSETCQGGVCTECDSATTDCDGDGWKVSDGDCCDKPGLCGSNPFLINPGAVEVLNGIDDNCNGLVDLFDTQDTTYCDDNLVSNSPNPGDYAKAMDICRTTTLNAPLPQRTWGLISAQIMRVDGSPLQDARAVSIRDHFGKAQPVPIEGKRVAVFSNGIASDSTETNPGPNGGPQSGNVSTVQSPPSQVDISQGGTADSIQDWYAIPNLPLKGANALPTSPGCPTGNSPTAYDSVMLVLKMRAPTNASAFQFNSYFFSAEFPRYVCNQYNDQFIALVDTPSGTPSPIPNPVDKNLLTYIHNNERWPISINISHGTNLFAVCDLSGCDPNNTQQVSPGSCLLGGGQLTGTGFEKQAPGSCAIGGGTFWLSTAGNVIPGQIVEIRIGLWDVGDAQFDSLALIDGFKWLANATVPGTN